MHAPTAAPFSFNPFDEATRRDPYALFARARREHPAWRHEGLPVVSVFRHADCQAILRDPETWSSVFPTPPGFAPEDVPRSMLVMDPPEHTRASRAAPRRRGASPRAPPRPARRAGRRAARAGAPRPGARGRPRARPARGGGWRHARAGGPRGRPCRAAPRSRRTTP